jgi:uncharacterized protein
MKILLSGSHGLVGSALSKALRDDGHEVTPLVRYAPDYGAAEVEWNPEHYSIVLSRLEGFDAAIHLAGESIAERWNEEKKKRIRDSRVNGTKLISESIAALKERPSVFISASAIGYYGNRGDEVLTEASSPGDDFLARVCVDWERATLAAAEKGIRTVNLRFGVILAKHGGALAKMLPPFRMGVGGRVGSGKQWMSWIALEDVVDGIRHVLRNDTLNGPLNFVAPEPVTNADFTKTLAKVLSRPAFFPMPEFGVRLAFGEMGEALLLSSQRVMPRRLLDSGYVFRYPRLESALLDILKRG